jgi:hypothetical protein
MDVSPILLMTELPTFSKYARLILPATLLKAADGLSKEFVNDVSFDIRQPEIAARESIGQSFMI